jgi:transcriptional regulator GlxA family with amidase domain
MHRAAPRLAATVLLLAALVLSAAAAAAPAIESGKHRLAAPEGRIPVAFVLTDGATMIDFAGPWEVFQDVMVPERGGPMSNQHPFDLYTVGGSREPVRTSGGMTVLPDHTFADAPMPKVVVVGAQRGAPGLTEWLAKAHAGGAVVMSVCTGAFKLADTGLLDGKRATTHHDFYDRFRERFPKVELVESRRFVESGERLYTAGGLTSGIDLALHVVELYFGRPAAQRTAEYMEYQGDGWKQPAAAGR